MNRDTGICVFRADASLALGGGHVMRCLSLAREMSGYGWRCLFACSRETPHVAPALARSGLELILLDEAPADHAADLTRELPGGCDLLVVDGYGFDASYEQRFQGLAGFICALDDLADRPHQCSVLSDSAPGRRPGDYSGLVPFPCRIFTGPRYALLRPEFVRARAAAMASRQTSRRIGKVFLGFGLMDNQNLVSRSLRAMAAAGLHAEADVAIGSRAPHLTEVFSLASALPFPVRVHQDSGYVPELMAAADIALGAGGVSALERCCLGLPSLMVTTAPNQRLVAEGLAASGAARLLGNHDNVDNAILAAALGEVSLEALQEMSREAFAVCDGRGCLRMLLAMAGTVPLPDGVRLALRLAEFEDSDLLFSWQTIPGMRRYFHDPTPPTPQGHAAWMTATLENPDRIACLVEVGGQACGMVRLDRLEETRFEISILTAPDMRGRGVARTALTAVRRAFPGLTLLADILPGNEASRKAFLAAGFQPQGEGRYHFPPA